MPPVPEGYATYESLLRAIMPNLRSCPPAVVAEQLVRSARDVCEHTNLWKKRMPFVPLQAGEAEYNYGQLPPNAEVSTVLSAQLVTEREGGLPSGVASSIADLFAGSDADDLLDGTPMTHVTAAALIAGEVSGVPAGWPTEGQEGPPRFIATLNIGKFAVAPRPNEEFDYRVQAYLALRPTFQATALPEEIMTVIWEPLYHRTLQVLHSQPGVPWASQASRDYHGSQYQFYRGRGQRTTGEVNSPKCVIPRPYE